jgi:lipopolysaccharide assembly outer membrane protein LptD (OstA)
LNRIPKTALFCLLLISAATILSGMNQYPAPQPQEDKKSKVIMEHADSTIFEKDDNPDIHVMRGNVRFRHDSTFLYCDSAFFYENDNSLEAFSNVHIEQGDTLSIYGNYLIYDGNQNLAKMRENVRMENHNNTLFTDKLDYDRNRNLGYFFDGGMLVDSINELTSVYGEYSPTTQIASFKKDVKLTNPQFILHSDTLLYNTADRVATIISPTIIESDSSTIHSSQGHYNTETGKASLYRRSIITSKDKTKTITADTLLYDRNTGFGEAFGHMELNDTVKKLLLTGNYGYYDDTRNFAFATDSAQFIEYSYADSLFLHADSLQMLSLGEERELKAFYGVRIYRHDLQGVCDSLQFNTADSKLYLSKNPILWNTGYQLTGDTIQILFNDSTIEHVNVVDRALAIEERDTTYFNQVKGRHLEAFFTAGELHRIDIEGNTESIYYPIEEEGVEYIGRNKTESAYMTIYIENRRPVRIKWPAATTAEMLPIPDLNPEQKFLKDFVDYNYLRPRSREDIFTPTVVRAEDIPAPRKHRIKP